jgi:hypothetical protein
MKSVKFKVITPFNVRRKLRRHLYKFHHHRLFHQIYTSLKSKSPWVLYTPVNNIYKKSNETLILTTLILK